MIRKKLKEEVLLALLFKNPKKNRLDENFKTYSMAFVSQHSKSHWLIQTANMRREISSSTHTSNNLFEQP
jgi:hypothetical protein